MFQRVPATGASVIAAAMPANQVVCFIPFTREIRANAFFIVGKLAISFPETLAIGVSLT